MPFGRSRPPRGPMQPLFPGDGRGWQGPAGPGNAALLDRMNGGRGLRGGMGNAAMAEDLAAETDAATPVVTAPEAADVATPVAPTADAAAADTVTPTAPTQAPSTGDAAAVETPAAASDLPAWAQRPNVTATLKEGATGEDVKALQTALGIAVTGTFDAATKAAVVAFQKAHDLGKDGVAGAKTLKALGLRDELRSASHDPAAFVPKYRATAYSESDEYRRKADPYAVGAITRPDAEDDDGGKTYGTYQFESFVYKDGSRKSDNAVTGSTVLRFVNWPQNPYHEQLAAVVKEHGVASEEFDALWTQLTRDDNKGFGQAQERFLEHDVGAKVTQFFESAKVPAALRTDPDLYDVVIGTLNQYSGLANGFATQLAARIAKMSSPTADAVGAALQDIKRGSVETNFKSSPNAWDGINARIDREAALFDS